MIRSTDNLVKAARQALSQEEEHQLVLHQKKVGSIAQVIDARADVLRIEKELEEARKKLAVIHKAKYQGEGGGGGFTDESDLEYDTRHESRLDTLLESSAERINSATNSFNLMRLQPTNSQNKQLPAPPPPIKPAVSPKPGSLDRKLNNSSPYSTMSSESSATLGGGPPPPPPTRAFQPFTPSSGPPSDDLYSRARQPNSPASVTTTKKIFMKPSEFIAKQGGPQQYALPQQHIRSFGGQDDSSSTVSQEYTQYDRGPLHEQVIETTSSDGTNISLKRIFQQQQTSSTSKVTSTRKFFQQKQEEQSEGKKKKTHTKKKPNSTLYKCTKFHKLKSIKLTSVLTIVTLW